MSRGSQLWGSRGRIISTTVIAVAVALTTLVVAPPAQADAAFSSVSAPTTWVPDGSTAERAAASCWEIKQNAPAATDGVYWLVTPTLIAPAQFYCDMTTDGGGWVLIGRGRDGWLDGGDGQGTAAQVRSDIWDQAGFRPRQLSDLTVDGLLNGTAPSSLVDGVRVVRAADRAGATTTDVRLRLTKMPRWSWAFGAGQPTDATIYGPSSNRDTRGRTSTVLQRVTTRNLDGDGSDGIKRLWTYLDSTNGWVSGFNYGRTVAGSTDASSFLYATKSAYATPMTQVWLRPELTTDQVTYPSVPDSGAPKEEQPPLAQSAALAATWGVAGLAGGNTDELHTEAHAFAQIGNVMYVGGNFARVEEHADRSPTGAATQSVPQSYLAAFDATTGAWLPGFRPVFDGQVNALAALPNGTLAVGGEFDTVNGVSQPALVALDPTTGATETTWPIKVEDRISSEHAEVQTMDVQGNWLYLGGDFTHFTGGSSRYAAYARKAARLNVADATPDPSWNPAFDGEVQSIDVSSDGSRVYASGYFTKSGTTTAMREAIISAAPGAAVIPFSPLYSVASSPYQQAIHATGDTFWVGGSEHSMFGYDASSLAPISLNVMRAGGDVQAITDNNDQIVYGGCHCGDWAFSGQQSYAVNAGDTNPTWQQANAIDYVGAWDAATGTYLPAFHPTAKARNGYGAWALDVASDGTLWAGGSFTSVVATDGRNQWAGGFVRFAVRPHTAPPAPSGLTAELSGQVAALSWTGSGGTGTTYEVLRGGRVVATTTQTSIHVSDSSPDDRFFVRATDGQGNRSATTAVASIRLDLVTAGSAWHYLVSASAPPAAWQSVAFDDSTWPSGAAPLGWGDPSIATNVDVPPGQQRPISTYYRRSFTVEDPSRLRALTLTTRADDGVVVYLNGHEVARKNLPAGQVGPSTYATAAPKTSAAAAAPLTVSVDPADLVTGSNVISVEVHANYRTTPNVSMDLVLSAQFADDGQTAPPSTEQPTPTQGASP